ncbi:hypothetical protein AVEN_67770-1 [Araneus ventricosus]|uniref:Uncharacterized protein n=1 Tax=Araneus ventricosus TaxID=182803 RepID=A0A4Y2HN84_ARAVE|nr:hypothetical protein AVEN_67770-1 [Araneus ventricosus]
MVKLDADLQFECKDRTLKSIYLASFLSYLVHMHHTDRQIDSPPFVGYNPKLDVGCLLWDLWPQEQNLSKLRQTYGGSTAYGKIRRRSTV